MLILTVAKNEVIWIGDAVLIIKSPKSQVRVCIGADPEVKILKESREDYELRLGKMEKKPRWIQV